MRNFPSPEIVITPSSRISPTSRYARHIAGSRPLRQYFADSPKRIVLKLREIREYFLVGGGKESAETEGSRETILPHDSLIVLYGLGWCGALISADADMLTVADRDERHRGDTLCYTPRWSYSEDHLVSRPLAHHQLTCPLSVQCLMSRSSRLLYGTYWLRISDSRKK
ncbi:hypothetical protein J6590_045242 [Homalodisca vitripennis]|nr:hypothetical protein J6590_045242 [Homalodisca vitripennis]